VSPESDFHLVQNALDRLAQDPALQTNLNELVRLAGQAAKSDACSLYFVDHEAQCLRPGVVIGLPSDYVRHCGNVPIGEQCCGRAVAHKKPWIVKDMLTDPLFASAREASDRTGIRAAFSVPVINAENEAIASLACHYRTPYAPTNYDIERNRIFATLIAFAMSHRGHRAATPDAAD
jgi:signal transduction protein with GAF and PtsI domain